MLFKGISKKFSLKNNQQYNTIGAFWDELEALYGLENLIGLGYKWEGGEIYYAIGLKKGEIKGCNFQIDLPDSGWVTVTGKTENLPQIYSEIYKGGALTFELESFFEKGDCKIEYYRK